MSSDSSGGQIYICIMFSFHSISLWVRSIHFLYLDKLYLWPCCLSWGFHFPMLILSGWILQSALYDSRTLKIISPLSRFVMLLWDSLRCSHIQLLHSSSDSGVSALTWTLAFIFCADLRSCRCWLDLVYNVLDVSPIYILSIT